MDRLGGKPLPEEWRPRTVGELRAVADKAFEMLRRMAGTQNELGETARTHFLENFRTILPVVGDPAVEMMRDLLAGADSDVRAEGAKAIGYVLASARDG